MLKRRTGVSSVDIWGNTAAKGEGSPRCILVNDDGQIILAPTSYINIHTGGGQGRKTNATPGSAEPIAASIAIKRVVISGLVANKQPVTIGFVGVVAAAGSETGKILYPGDSYEMTINDLAKIYLDVRSANDGVAFLFFT